MRYAEVSPADRDRLSGYLEYCGQVDIGTYNRNEQFAFWINLYNSLTVQTILDAYPIASLRSVGLLPSWLSGGPWKKDAFGWRVST